MSSPTKFRIWDQLAKAYWHTLEGAQPGGIIINASGDVGMVCDLMTIYEPKSVNWFSNERLTVEHWTGLLDAGRKEIFEGDILLASEARYVETLLSDPDSDDIPVYFSDHDKPLPAPDVPWFKAVVEWNETMCGFWLRYLDKRADWGPAVSTRLTDKIYRYEVVGNVHEGAI